jgi:CRP-like cAMP-binding protein
MGNRTIFGELSLLFKGKRTATVKSQEACYVIVIPADSFNKYMRAPMLKKLNIIISFYRALNFMDGLDKNTLLILASKTNITILQSSTLVVRQDNKSKYLYFIKKGRVKILRSIEIIDNTGKEITVENYKCLFKEPEPFHRKKGMTKFLLLELTELGQFECFGEDVETISNFLLSPT